MIKTQVFQPACFTVTLVAAGAQRPLVRILPFMAAVTGLVLDGSLHIIAMALLARGFLMGAVERESGPGVIETAGAPGGFRMALLAVGAIAAFMNVIVLMTAIAGRRCVRRRHIGRMAGLARYFLMGAAQGVPGVERVVERGLLPAFAGVTGLAFGTKAAQVHVIDPVTAAALLVGTLEIACLVALVAAQRGMFIPQRKRRFVVIKRGFQPLLAVVATLAIFTLFALVNIITAMTAYAGRWRFTIGVLLVMALCAGECSVLSLKEKIGVLMHEGGRIQLHECSIPALMFGVAQSAFAACDAGCLAVKAFLVQDILANGFVAARAVLLLVGVLAFAMALLAFVFVSGVRFTEWPRAQHRFKIEIDGDG